MSEVYVYEPKGQNLDGLGIVGALDAISCTHDEAAGGNSEIMLEHPYDELGKWESLTEGRLLKCWVPVRETPQLRMEAGSTVTTVTREVYQVQTTNGRLHLRKKPGTSSTIIGRYNSGTEVVKLANAGPANGYNWYKVAVSRDGATGYMATSYLTYVRTYTEVIGENDDAALESVDDAARANWSTKPQFFEIYRRAPSDEGVTVYARHVSYKLLKNLTTYQPSGDVSLQTALNGILGNCALEHDFAAYTDVSEMRSGVGWKDTNPIKAMLDAENGVLAKWGCEYIRDNWDLFFLRRGGRNRGVKIEHGKNLVGIKADFDISDVATRIKPVGRKKDGTDLLLPEVYVDSPYIDSYAEPMLYRLECSDCKIGTDGMTEAQALAKMRERAQAMIDGGCDRPKASLQVDFMSLGDSEEYAQYRDMDRLFLYDEVEIVTRNGYADAITEVVSLSWDCLHDRAIGIQAGSVAASLTSSKLASWQIPSGVSGDKLLYGSVGSAQLGGEVISARHVQSESINTEALQAGSVTAEKIAAGAVDAQSIEAITAHIDKIVAGDITTDQLYAALAKITTAQIEHATIDWAQIGNVDIDTADIKNADIDWAHIKDLVSDTAIITQGVGGELYIARLAVTEANMVSLTVGELIVKGSDGGFYALGVDADGNVTTTLKQVSNNDVADLSINGGEKIIEGSITAAKLNVQDIFAENAIIASLIAAHIDVEELFAREVFTNEITALAEQLDLSANTSVNIMIKDNVDEATSGLNADIESANNMAMSAVQNAQNAMDAASGVEAAKDAATAAQEAANAAQDAAESAQNAANATEEKISAWFSFRDDGLETRKSGSTYSTLVDDTGFHVQQLGGKIGSFAKRQLSTEAVRIGKVGSAGKRVVMREAADGGVAFVLEGSV